MNIFVADLSMLLKITPYLILISVIAFSSCEESQCGTLFTSDFEVEYFRISNVETDSQMVDQPSINFHRVYALGNEDSLFYEDQARTTLILRVDPAETFTSYVIITIDSTSIEDSVQVFNDTLTVEYKRRQRLISEDCGPEQLYVDFNITTTTYDSVNLLVDQLRVTNERDIQIFN